MENRSLGKSREKNIFFIDQPKPTRNFLKEILTKGKVFHLTFAFWINAAVV